MFGKLLKSVSWQVKADFHRSLKFNLDHKRLSWNLAERLQIYCSTHYILAMVILWGAAASAIGVAEYFRPVFYPFAREHLKGITFLSGWMSNLLGSQLTIIGIVFPLVVGLISVLFQKKSSRIHIQSAYQLHSGYMFSGLSGLSLAAFILIGGLASSGGDKYLDTAFSVTAFVWMIFNICLSIWFFITSLNVLDDNKRDHLMNKYFKSQMVNEYLQKSIVSSWIRYPGYYIGGDYLVNIKILSYSSLEKNGLTNIKCKVNKDEVVKDIYMRPLLFLLKKLRTSSSHDAEITILPTSVSDSGNLTIFSSKGVHISKAWSWFYKRCFLIGKKQEGKNLDNITYDFFGDAYDALNDKNISIYKLTVVRLINTYTSIKRSFSHVDGNYLDGKSESDFSYSFSQSFHFDLRRFLRDAIKSTETTGIYFYEAMHIPLYVYRNSESTRFIDFKQYIESLFAVWHVVIDWKAGNGVTLSVSQEQTHQEIIRSFIGQWEGLGMGFVIGKPDDSDFAYRLLYHLQHTVRLLVPAVVSNNWPSAKHAHDVLCLWYKQSNSSRYWNEEYLWHSFFLTPDYLNKETKTSEWNMLLKGNPYNEKAAKSIIFANALVDMRLLISGYLIVNFEPNVNMDLVDLVDHLLESKLYEDRDINESITPKFKTATDIIDVILRMENSNRQEDNNWYNQLSLTIESLNSFNERPMIPGRIYSGIVDDLGCLYGAFSLLAIKLIRDPEQVTQRVIDALEGGVFSYVRKCQIIHTLTRLKRDPTEPYDGYMVSSDLYASNVTLFNDTIERYITVFSLSKNEDIITAEVDLDKMKKTDARLTEILPRALSEDILLSKFRITEDSDFKHDWQMRCLSATITKDFIANEINENFLVDYPSIADVKTNIIHRLHYILGKSAANINRQVNDLAVLLQEVKDNTVNQDGYTFIMYGSRFRDEMRDLIYTPDRHTQFGLQVDTSSRGINGFPIRINNCMIFQVSNTKLNYSLLVRNASFGELKIFQYPDGTLFNTFYRSSVDPLEGVIRTLWEIDMQVTSPLVARFEHI